MTDFDIAQNTLVDIMSNHAHHSPGKLAVADNAKRLTWGQLETTTNRIANAYLAAGLKHGDRVALIMSSSVDSFCLTYGIVKAGGCVVPISTMLTPSQIAFLVTDSGARALVADADTKTIAAAARALLTTVEPSHFLADEDTSGWKSYQSWMRFEHAGYPDVTIGLDDDFAVSYSSGTTGLPKGVVYSHRGRQMMGLTYAIEFEFNRYSIAVVTTPLYSNGTSLMMYPALVAGGALYLMRGFDAGAFMDIVETERATHTFMVPTQFISALNHTGFDAQHLSSMRVFLTAGSPMRPDTRRQVEAVIGPRLFELYGYSEGGATVLRPEELNSHRDSVGKPAVGFDVRVLDPNGDDELARGETGELAFYGSWMVRRYQNNPELTQATIWRDERGRSFVRSGDIGKLDEDGFVYLIDRKKDMIISGGFNVYPVDIETVLGAHDEVRDVTVVGVPHRKWGETPVAFVVLEPGAITPLEGLRTWANKRLAGPQKIAAIEAREQFPRNALGKVIKPELRAAFGNRFDETTE